MSVFLHQVPLITTYASGIKANEHVKTKSLICSSISTSFTHWREDNFIGQNMLWEKVEGFKICEPASSWWDILWIDKSNMLWEKAEWFKTCKPTSSWWDIVWFDKNMLWEMAEGFKIREPTSSRWDIVWFHKSSLCLHCVSASQASCVVPVTRWREKDTWLVKYLWHIVWKSEESMQVPRQSDRWTERRKIYLSSVQYSVHITSWTKHIWNYTDTKTVREIDRDGEITAEDRKSQRNKTRLTGK